MSISHTVTKKLKLFQRDKVLTLVDGIYDSLFQGKGLELDSIRDYVVGDNVKDIDWRATARVGSPQTKLYVASRDQQFVVIADTSKSMLIAGHGGLMKRDALYGIVALIGAFVRKNQDMISLAYAEPNGKTTVTRFSNSVNHTESLLQKIERSIQTSGPQNPPLEDIIAQVAATIKKRSALLIVSDGFKDLKLLKKEFTKARNRHSIFFIQLDPSSPLVDNTTAASHAIDIETAATVDQRIIISGQLAKEWTIMANQYFADTRLLCRKLGIPYTYVKDETKVIDAVRDLFNQAKRYAQRRK